MTLYYKQAWDGATVGRWWTTDANSVAPVTAPVGSWIAPCVTEAHSEDRFVQLSTTLVDRMPVTPTWAYAGNEFLTSTGNRLNDLTGGGNHATSWFASGGTPFLGSMEPLGGTVEGPSSGYGQYDGFHLTGLTTTTADREAFTASALVLPHCGNGLAGTNYYGTLLRLGHATAESHVMWDLTLAWNYQSGGLQRIQIGIGHQSSGGVWSTYYPDERYHAGVPFHLLVSRSAASGGFCTHRVWVNGRLLGEGLVGLNDTTTTASGALLIARQTGTGSGAYNGTVANVAVWRDVCLNADQVAHVYAIMRGCA